MGANSLINPDVLPTGFYTRACNMVNRGGLLQTRPGYRCKMAIPRGRIQGASFFRPQNGPTVILFAVEGLLYITDTLFSTFRQLPDVQFAPEARQVFFQQVEQSVRLNDDLSLTLVDKRNLLIMQDGGTARAVVFDGTSAEHTADIPSGGPMAFVGDRLWVARGSSLFASDLGNPISFVEPLYIAGSATSFALPGKINALSKIPSTQLPQLLAFTDTTTTVFQAGIRARSQWATTPDFQKDIFPEVGCVAPRSVVAQKGLLSWYSLNGWTTMDAAAQANVSSALPYQDAEMTDSKARLSSDLTGIASAVFENYTLVSVPHADLLNTHTWVLDNSVLPGRNSVAWNGFWTGTRPVEWLSGIVDGVNRILFFSSDYDDENRLWEAFTPDRNDSGCPITWWFETRGMNFSFPSKEKDFRYADFFLAECSGVVDIAVFWAATFRGKFKRILTKRIKATRGSIRSGEVIKATDKIFALKKQSRPLRTQDAKALNEAESLPSCGVESPNADFRDENFQMLVVGSGPAAVRGFVAYAEPPSNVDDSGRVEKDETEENFVRFDGAAAESPAFQEALEEFDGDLPVFTSTRTETVSAQGLSETSTAEAESVISQENADHVASTIARRRASANLERALPKIVSLGAVANDIE
jgi:hypothetical protein